MSNIFKQIKARVLQNKSVTDRKNSLTLERHYKINVLLSLAVLLVGGFYLVEVNGLSTKGYRIRELEHSVTRLQGENEKLSVKVTEARSMASLQEKIKGFSMVTSDRIDYLSDKGVAMASR